MNITILQLALGLGLIAVFALIIYLTVKTSKKRAREVEELNQHFPEPNDQPVTVETMRGKLRRSQRTGAEVAVNVEEEKGTQDKEVEVEGELTEAPSNERTLEKQEEVDSEDRDDEGEKPVRYRRSIFHPDHLKKDHDETKTE